MPLDPPNSFVDEPDRLTDEMLRFLRGGPVPDLLVVGDSPLAPADYPPETVGSPGSCWA